MQKISLRIIYTFFIRWFLKLIIGVKFDNSKFLLNEDQFIIVANHNSHLDTITLLSSLPCKLIHKVKPVAAGDYFGNTKLKGKLTSFFVNALLIPRKIDRNKPENDPIKKILNELDKGYSLIIFPEGTRGEPEKEQAFKNGVGRILSQRPTIKFVPAYLKGMGKAMPKNDSLPIPFNSTLNYGTPTKPISTNSKEITQQIEQSFKKLKQKTINSN